MSSNHPQKSVTVPTTAEVVTQRCALGITFAALVCVGLALQTGQVNRTTTTNDVVVSTETPAWFSENQFLTTEALESDRKYSKTDLALLLTFPRSWYEASWPTYDDLPRGDSERLRFQTIGPAHLRTDWGSVEPPTQEWSGQVTEYVGMSPSVSPEEMFAWHWDWEFWDLPLRWTGPIDLLQQLTASGNQGRFPSRKLTDVLSCLYLNGFTSCRLNDQTVLAGHGGCTVELTVTDSMVGSCKFVAPHAAIQRAMANNGRLLGQNGRSAYLNEIDQNAILHKHPLAGSFPISRGYFLEDHSRSIPYTPAPVSAPSGSEQWVTQASYLTADTLRSTQESFDSFTASASAPCSKPSWVIEAY